MALALGTNIIQDGDPVKMGTTQIDKLYIGTNVVWQNSAVPGTISDFNATDNQTAQITMSWSAAGGIPAPTYNVVRVDDGETRMDVVSPYIWGGITSGAVDTFRVDAVNSAGTSPSNGDSGQAYIIPSAIVNFAASDGGVGSVSFTWTNASGTPTPTYNIMQGTTVIATGATSGYAKSYSSGIGATDYHVIATNTAGSTSSNIDSGSAEPVPVAPATPTNCVATDNQVGQVTVTWVNSASGIPTPTHNVVEGSVVVGTDVTSPYVRTVDAGTRDYSVQAVNSAGTATSNVDTGTSYSVPSAPTSFVASDNQTGQVTVTFTDSTSGLPAPSYDLYADSALATASISSGYVYSVAAGTKTYYVKAVNAAGSADSNTDSGTSYSMPSAIVDFNATDNQVDQVTFSWSDASGVPAPTYDIEYDKDGVWTLHNADVTSPFVLARTFYGDVNWRVLAKNSVGSTPSNEDTGHPVYPPYVGPPSPITITATSTLIAGTDFPADTAITACLVGGGASGARQNMEFFNVNGGLAGTVSSGVAGAFAYNTSAVATVGAGGAGMGAFGDLGNVGTPSSFGAISGAGGITTGHNGNGAEVTTCGGTANDGVIFTYITTFSFGGQSSGFADGGNGSYGSATAGGVGSGGGGEGSSFAGPISGAGGRGEIHLSW